MDITREMTIQEVVERFPETVQVFRQFGVACLGCSGAHYDNIEQGAAYHGLDVERLLQELNTCVARRS